MWKYCKYCGREIEKGSYCSDCSSLRRKRKLYGITELEYERMMKCQKKCCAICGKKMIALVVDHNHTTGVVRGLLCGECNLGLGKFKDSPKLLDKASQYLLRYDL